MHVILTFELQASIRSELIFAARSLRGGVLNLACISGLAQRVSSTFNHARVYSKVLYNRINIINGSCLLRPV